MNLPRNVPRDPTNDRRTVPRHIRDGEHDTIEEAMSSFERPPASPLGRVLMWCGLLALLAGGLVWWMTRS